MVELLTIVGFLFLLSMAGSFMCLLLSGLHDVLEWLLVTLWRRTPDSSIGLDSGPKSLRDLLVRCFKGIFN